MTRAPALPIYATVNTFLQILSQLAWGVTVGALVAAVTAAAKLLFVPCAGLAAYGFWRWRKKRSKPNP